MLSQEEIATRVARKKSLTSAGVGLEFGKSLVSQLQTLHAFGDTREKVNTTASNALDTINTTYNQVQQNDLTRAILSGIDINSGTIAQVFSNRQGVLLNEQKRLNDERTRALQSISDQETTSFIGNAVGFLLGAFGWLL